MKLINYNLFLQMKILPVLLLLGHYNIAPAQVVPEPSIKPSDCVKLPLRYACNMKKKALEGTANPIPPSETKIIKVDGFSQVLIFIEGTKRYETWNVRGVCIYRSEKERPGKFHYFDKSSEYFNQLGNPLLQFEELPSDTKATQGNYEGKKAWILKNSKFELYTDRTTLLPIASKFPGILISFEFAPNPPQSLEIPEEKKQQLEKAREFLGLTD